MAGALSSLPVSPLRAVAETSATWGGDGAVKGMYKGDGGRLGDYLPGTCYFCGYALPSGREATRWEPGDRLVLHCELVASDDERSAACDTFTLHVTLGNGELPLGIEWPLLGLRWGADLHYPIANAPAVLDSRFTKCGSDSSGYFTRLTVVAADTTDRANAGPRMARLRRAVDAFRVNTMAPSEALARIEATFDDDRRDPLRSVLYAGALSDAGECWAYGQQAGHIAELGLSCQGMTADAEYRHCQKWSAKPKGR